MQVTRAVDEAVALFLTADKSGPEKGGSFIPVLWGRSCGQSQCDGMA